MQPLHQHLPQLMCLISREYSRMTATTSAHRAAHAPKAGLWGHWRAQHLQQSRMAVRESLCAEEHGASTSNAHHSPAIMVTEGTAMRRYAPQPRQHSRDLPPCAC